MFHINDKQEPRPCRAKTPDACRFYQSEEDPRHYQTARDASVAAEELLKKKYGDTQKANKYSFMKNFKRLEEEFSAGFDGVPNRFFNADLRGKLVHSSVDPKVVAAKLTLEIRDADTSRFGYFQANKLYSRLAQAMSSPKDSDVEDSEVEKFAADQGITNLKRINSSAFATKRAWRGEVGDKVVVITDPKSGEDFSTYRFRFTPKDVETPRTYGLISTRTLVGAQRIKNKTGASLTKSLLGEKTTAEREVNRILTLHMLSQLEEAQEEGREFIAQKKYVSTHSGKVATAWMDKKNPDKVRQDLMKNHDLGGMFRHVEIDNEVDPAEYADFEKEINEVSSKLPSIPDDRKPELRIRKLGKHKANGVFFPHKNTVAVDVRTSEAFIHEMGHYYDLAVKDNASLKSDFREISREYIKNLKAEPASKAEYYQTPTEIFARGFELYAHKRLGISNRLLNPDKFDRFDYTPFTANPELEQRLFDLMERTFKEE